LDAKTDPQGVTIAREFTGSAAKVWLELHTRFNGRNNGLLSLSLEDGARLLGMGKSTAARAMKELEAKGFLKLTKRGHFYGRLASEYALTTKPHQGHQATHDWRLWKRPTKPHATIQKQRRGTDTGHIAPLTGPLGHRRNGHGPTSKPVNGQSGPSIGTETGHL
jgi:hypothetical protein